MDPFTVLLAFSAMGAVWTGSCVWVFAHAKKQSSFDSVYARSAFYRRRFLIILLSLIIIVFAVSLFYLPYADVRSQAFGKPAVVVNVVGIQWAWSMSTQQLPSSVPVEFNVTSRDVNHDFGIFNSQGVLIGQVQALPGYYNQLIMIFKSPGTYTVRCLDFCGPGHALMISQFTVT